MNSKQAAEALVKARDLTKRASANRRHADARAGTADARKRDERADQQEALAEKLFDQILEFLSRT